jgi:hypothetical protein
MALMGVRSVREERWGPPILNIRNIRALRVGIASVECDLHGFRVTLEMTGDMVETGLSTSEGKGIGRDSVGRIGRDSVGF